MRLSCFSEIKIHAHLMATPDPPALITEARICDDYEEAEAIINSQASYIQRCIDVAPMATKLKLTVASHESLLHHWRASLNL
jgi:hypothetical protein